MNRRRWSLIIATIALFLLSFSFVHAQSSTPIIVLSNGDLWSWREGEDTLTRLSQSGYIVDMVVSPDGTKLAYLQLPDVVIDAIQRVGGFGGGQLPGDMWVMDLNAATTQKVVGQPEGTSFYTENVPDKYTVRSMPVWSPDSTQLAWTEYGEGDAKQLLMVGTWATGQASAIVGDVETSMGVTAPTPIIGWTESGIALWNVFYVQGNFNNEQEVITSYTPRGELTAYTEIPQTEDRYLNQVIALKGDDNRDYVAIHFNTGEWTLVDQLTGTVHASSRVPERYSTSSPDTSLSVVTIDNGENDSTDKILNAQGNPVDIPLAAGFEIGNLVAFSPDGQTLAVRYYNNTTQAIDPFITLLRNGQGVATSPTQVKSQDVFITNFVWGAMGWRLSDVPVATPTAAVSLDCPGAPPTRFAAGMTGQVTFGGGSNNLRALAGRDGAKVGEIPEGGVFEVIDGPVCADGFVWWRVVYNGDNGWTAEGDTSSYYIEPVQ